MWLLKKEAGFPNAESFAPGSTPEGEVGQPGVSLPAHPQEEKHRQNKASSQGRGERGDGGDQGCSEGFMRAPLFTL